MAEYNVEISKHANLLANVADKVTISRAFRVVEVVNHGASYLFINIGEKVPVAYADNTTVIPPMSSLILNVPTPTIVGLVCQISTSYSVQGRV